MVTPTQTTSKTPLIKIALLILLLMVLSFILGAMISNSSFDSCMDTLKETCETTNICVDFANKQTVMLNKCLGPELDELGIYLPNLTRLDCVGLG